MTAPSYSLTTLKDLLSVPVDRREDCVREILYLLALHELAFGEEARDAEFKNLVWTDDGNRSVALQLGDDDQLRLDIAPAGCTCHHCIKELDLKGQDGIFPLSLTQMILCPTCGNKRCPHASNHRLACTDSNEPGQPGSIYCNAT